MARTLFVFKGLQHISKESIQNCDFDYEAIFMVKLVKLVRKEDFECSFSGSFPSNCQENSVSPTFKMVISVLLNGTNVTNKGSAESQNCLTIAQLIYFNEAQA